MQPKFSTIVINKSTAVTQISASLIMFFFNDTLYYKQLAGLCFSFLFCYFVQIRIMALSIIHTNLDNFHVCTCFVFDEMAFYNSVL